MHTLYWKLNTDHNLLVIRGDFSLEFYCPDENSSTKLYSFFQHEHAEVTHSNRQNCLSMTLTYFYGQRQPFYVMNFNFHMTISQPIKIALSQINRS